MIITINFIFDTDFEFLNMPDISQIIIIGKRILDFEFRMKMAGISESKIIKIDSPAQLKDHLLLETGSYVEIIYGIYQAENYKKIYNEVIKKLTGDLP